MKDITLSMIRVTEAAALAASRWVGSGNKEQADKAATDAIRCRMNGLPFMGNVMIGEGKKDKSYGLFYGDKVGAGHGPTYDIAVDPIEGTTPTVESGPEAISALGVAVEGSMFHTEKFYMKKLAYGPAIKSKVTLSLNDPIERTLELVSKATGKKHEDIMVCILDRIRHRSWIQKMRDLGVRIKLIKDCDLTGALATCRSSSGVDLLWGIGGAPEAILTACAMKCLDGDFQAQIATSVNGWMDHAVEGEVLFADDLVKGECAFVATGITDGSLLRGVRYEGIKPVTHSILMRSESGTVRWVETFHGN